MKYTRITKNGETFGIYIFPKRKKPSLCIQRGNELIQYATFNDEESAAEFMDYICEFFHVRDAAPLNKEN